MHNKVNSIDLRQELDLLKGLMGHYWVALRVADMTKPCKECMLKEDPNLDQPAYGCKSCMGIGFAYVDKLVKAYRYQAAVGLGLDGNIGVMDLESRVFILENGQVPKRFDWILELELDETTMTPKQPFRAVSAFKIDDALPLRGDNGRIEFFKCYTKNRILDIGKRIA
jgi:hypothetical protein